MRPTSITGPRFVKHDVNNRHSGYMMNGAASRIYQTRSTAVSFWVKVLRLDWII